MCIQRKDDSTPGTSVIELTSGISSSSEPPSLCLKGTCDRAFRKYLEATCFQIIPHRHILKTSQLISTPLLCSCRLVSTSTSSGSYGNDTNHVLGRPGRRIPKKLHHLCFALFPGKIKRCLASAQSKPLPQDQSSVGRPGICICLAASCPPELHLLFPSDSGAKSLVTITVVWKFKSKYTPTLTRICCNPLIRKPSMAKFCFPM